MLLHADAGQTFAKGRTCTPLPLQGFVNNNEAAQRRFLPISRSIVSMASTMHCHVQCLAPFRSGRFSASKGSSPAARRLQIQCGEILCTVPYEGTRTYLSLWSVLPGNVENLTL